MKHGQHFRRFRLAFVVVLTICSFAGTAYGDDNMQRLMSDLTASANKYIRPMKNFNDTMTVAILLKLHRVVDLDFRQETITTQVTMEQVWNNYLMRWDEGSYGGIKEIVFPAKDLWVPDLAIHNSADGRLFFDRDLVKVYFTGYVEWKSKAVLTTLCDFSRSGFPYDQHTCKLKFGSWNYDGTQLDFQQKGGRLLETEKRFPVDETGSRSVIWESPIGPDRSEYIYSTDWELVKTSVVMTQKTHETNDLATDVTYFITVRRNPGAWIRTAILPWILLTLLPLLVFLIPVQSEQKVTFIVLNLLVLFVLIAPVGTRSDAQIFMASCYAFTLLFEFLIACATLIVIFVHNRTFEMPNALKDLVGILAKITCSDAAGQIPKQQQHKPSLAVIDEDPSPGLDLVAKHLRDQDSNEAVKADWHTLANILDRVFLCIFTVAAISGIIALCC